MILTIDGNPIMLHPITAAMIALLVDNQEPLWRQGYGCVLLDYAPQGVSFRLLKIHKAVTNSRTTVDRVPPTKS